MTLLSLLHPYHCSAWLGKQTDFLLSFSEKLRVPLTSVAVENTVHLLERRTLCLRKIEMYPRDGTSQEDGKEDICTPSPCLQKLYVSLISWVLVSWCSAVLPRTWEERRRQWQSCLASYWKLQWMLPSHELRGGRSQTRASMTPDPRSLRKRRCRPR